MMCCGCPTPGTGGGSVGSTTLAEARAICLQLNDSATETSDLDTLIAFMRADRAAGFTVAEEYILLSEGCDEATSTQLEHDTCIQCIDALIDVVWQ